VRGEAGPDSDIDIATFSSARANMSLEEEVNLLVRVEMKIQAEVEIHLFSDRCLEEARPTNFYGYILERGKRIA
jgi:predicted nucleotidyltransferase